MRVKDRLLSVDEVGKYLALSRRQIYRLLESGQLAGYKLGKVWRLKEKDVAVYLRRRRKRIKYPGRVFLFYVLTEYHQSPQKYRITKRGTVGWVSLRKKYLKGLSPTERAKEDFKPIKYHHVRLSDGYPIIVVAQRYLDRLPKAEQKRWQEFEMVPERIRQEISR